MVFYSKFNFKQESNSDPQYRIQRYMPKWPECRILSQKLSHSPKINRFAILMVKQIGEKYLV